MSSLLSALQGARNQLMVLQVPLMLQIQEMYAFEMKRLQCRFFLLMTKPPLDPISESHSESGFGKAPLASSSRLRRRLTRVFFLQVPRTGRRAPLGDVELRSRRHSHNHLLPGDRGPVGTRRRCPIPGLRCGLRVGQPDSEMVMKPSSFSSGLVVQKCYATLFYTM